MSKTMQNDPNAPIYRVVRHIVLHFLYLALSVAFFFAMGGLGFDVAIHVYFVVVLLIPLAFWLAVVARRKLSRQASGADES